jgi:hypothetical protein
MKHFSPDMSRARWEARILRNALLQKGIKLTAIAVLDIVSLTHGWESWQSWEQEQDWKRQPDPGRHENKSRGTAPTYSERSRKGPETKDGMTIDLYD